MLRFLFTQLVRLYGWTYALFCGSYPNLRPWHYQWCATHALNRALREVLPLLEGRVLVVGNGSLIHPAQSPRVREFVTVAAATGPDVALAIQPNAPWSLPSASFDAALCINALTTLPDPEHVAAEMARVLRPSGLVVVSAPALGAAGVAPLRYYKAGGLALLLNHRFTLTSMQRMGAIGSTLALLVLGWLEALAGQRLFVRLLQFTFLPMWLAICGALNLAALLLDAVDPTRAFYTNVLIVAVRKADGATPHLKD